MIKINVFFVMRLSPQMKNRGTRNYIIQPGFALSVASIVMLCFIFKVGLSNPIPVYKYHEAENKNANGP